MKTVNKNAILQMLVPCALVVVFANSAICQWEERADILEQVEKTFGDPPGMVRLDPDSRVWADKKNKRIVVDGYIALTSGQLEMMACPVGTKEHESVVATFCKAQIVHAGLLAVGAKKGKPVTWDPVYAAPTGTEVQVFALWKDKDGKKHHIDTRKWARQVGTREEILETNFVFAGSKMWRDPDTGKEEYMAEAGDLICLSNFSTATLDVPMESSKANAGLMFAAFTDRIPERGTPVRLVLQVVDPNKSADARNTASQAAPSKNADPIPSLDSLSDPPADK